MQVFCQTDASNMEMRIQENDEFAFDYKSNLTKVSNMIEKLNSKSVSIDFTVGYLGSFKGQKLTKNSRNSRAVSFL